MLRKLIMFAITSGLAKKAWDHYRARPSAPVRTSNLPSSDLRSENPTQAAANHVRATTVGAGPL